MNWQAFLLGALLWTSGITFFRWKLLRSARRRLEKSEAMYHHATMARDVRTEEEREFHISQAAAIYHELQKNR